MTEGRRVYASCTITLAAIANGDFPMIARQIERLRRTAPQGATLIVAKAHPANPWYRPGDAVDVIAVPPERVNAETVLYVQTSAEPV
jgi:hypothetical protein